MIDTNMLFSGFRPTRMRNGSMSFPGIEMLVIGASQTIAEGSALKVGGSEAGYAADAVTDLIGGYVVGYIVKPGDLNLPLDLVASNTAYVDGTFTRATTGSNYAAAADNVTDKKVAVLYMPVNDVVASGKLSANAATTTGSKTVGYYLDIEATAGNYATLLDEATASTTSANYLLVDGNSGSDATDPAAPLTADRRVMVVANETEI